MSNANEFPPPAVTPQPGAVKTIGIFNLIFGGILLLCGTGCLSTVLQGLVNNTPWRIDPKNTQLVLDEIHKQRVIELQQREQNAPSPEQKAILKTQREAIEANKPKVEGKLDFATVNAGLAWTRRYLQADILSGPFLNLLLVISGIGLVLRKNWGRVLALVTAVLKIVRLIALCVLLVVYVVPRGGQALSELADSPIGKELFENAMEQQNARRGGPPPGPQPGPKEVAEYLAAFGNSYAFLLPCLGSIYPVIVLVLLTRPGARAACLIGDEERTGEEPWDESRSLHT